MECCNYKECNQRLEKIMKKIKQEIKKVDMCFCKYARNDDEIICYNPKKCEKKEIINTIKANSQACCILFEELKKHRTEVKYLIKAYDKFRKKQEKLKTIQNKQLKKIESIHCYIKSNFSPLINIQDKRERASNFFKNKENEDLEKRSDKVVSEAKKLVQEYEESKQILSDFNNKTETKNEDKILFCDVMNCIKKVFDIYAEIECKKLDFIEFACYESENEINDKSDFCCNTI